MSKQFESFIDSCERAVSTESDKLSAEFVAAAKQIGDAVESWGVKNSLMTPKRMARDGQFFAANESFAVDNIEQGLGPQAIADLVAEANVAPCHRKAAARKIAAVLCQVLGKEGAIAFADYNTTVDVDSGSGRRVSLEQLYGPTLWQAVAPATEAFGINMDRVTPDLKTILTVSLLQFHVALTPRIVPIQAVTQSNVQITREAMEIFDMSKPNDPPRRPIDLYRDPSMVSTRATRIEPLSKNDANGKYLVSAGSGENITVYGKDKVPAPYEHGVYKFEEESNLFDLSLDDTRPGYDRVNHTDIIEDGMAADGILVEVSKTSTEGEGDQAQTTTTSEKFLLTLPVDRARLTQINDDYRSTARRLALDHLTLALNAATPVFGSTEDSEVLADFTKESTKYLGIRLNMSVHVDRKTGNMTASAWGKTVIKSTDPSYTDTEGADAAAAEAYTVKFLGFTLDARFNEDNKRKTSIRAEINRRNMSYELPSGRNFVIDFAIGQEGAVNAAARLAQVEVLGRDDNNLKIVTTTLDQVHDQRLALGNGVDANMALAIPYAAGDLVHQVAYRDTIDFSKGFLAVKSADASGDIKQFVKQRLNKIVTGLNASSLIQHQLADGTPVTYRMITSPFILGTILSCRHIREHLDGLDQKGTGSVEYVLNLDCGARLEVVTTSFDVMQYKMLIIPYFESAPTSVLNFGTNYDQGTLVGTITLGADATAAHNRMFSTTREALIPTNVVGATIEVVGLGDARVALDFPGQANG